MRFLTIFVAHLNSIEKIFDLGSSSDLSSPKKNAAWSGSGDIVAYDVSTPASASPFRVISHNSSLVPTQHT